MHVIYWCHPDYLGNTEYITDWNGDPYQFFWYSPWGGSLVNQHKFDNPDPGTNYYRSPFSFNAKELDAETGNYYYGARYYDPKVSVWLSVDPLSSKYPHITPYNFVENNPINLIDPTGLGPGDPINIMPSGKTVGIWYKMKQHFGQVIDLDLASKGASIGAGVKVQVGPLKLGAEVNLIDVEGHLDVDDMRFEGNLKHGTVEGEAGLGPFRAKGEAGMAKEEIKAGIDKNGSPYLDRDVLDSDGYSSGSSSTSGEGWSLNNSGRLGITAKVFGQKVQFGVNLGHLGVGVGKFFEAAASYIGDLAGLNPRSSIEVLPGRFSKLPDN